MQSFNEVFKGIINDIEVLGDISQPRDMKVKELTVQNHKVDSTLPFANFESRKFNWKYFAGELVWYLNKDRDVDYIGNFSNFWKNITNPSTNEINSNYGSLLFGDQLYWVKQSLIQDKNTRQAIAFLNQPKFQFTGNKDFVCTMYLNFWIRNNELHMKVQMRSNDIFYGLTFDAPFFALVHQHMLLWLKDTYQDLQLGTYHHCTDNIHFYERHFELAETISKDSSSEDYKMELKEPLFYLDDMHSELELTEYGNNLISAVNSALKNESPKSEYYNILSEYLNINTNSDQNG